MKIDPVIFFDIDNTLIDGRTKMIPESTVFALQQLKNAGFSMCIASGRDICVIPPEVKNILQWDYFICCNGHIICDSNGTPVYKKYFPRDVVKKCIQIAEKTGIGISLKTEDKSFILKEPDNNMKNAYNNFGTNLPAIDKYIDQKIVGIVIFPSIGERAYGFDSYDAVETFYGVDCYCDITLKGFDKVNGIYEVVKRMGYRSFIAVGDSENDLKMIHEAALGIAMGNASDRIKKEANFVTARVDENGIAYAVSYILAQKE